MHIFHKYQTVAESPKWEALQCVHCGKVKWIEKFQGGYQPMPPLPKEIVDSGEGETRMKVFYLCDRRACRRCSNPDGQIGNGMCNHTSNIEHARNFCRTQSGCMRERPTSPPIK